MGTLGTEGYSSIQGKVAVSVVMPLSLAGGGVEGGFFVGINAPKSGVWILEHEHSRFKLDMTALPNRLTGIYGYTQVHAGFNIYVFSGGIDIYMGLGGFILTATQASALHVIASGFIGLPYALGHLGVYLHGEILGGLVSAGGWGDFQIMGPYPFSFRGTVGLEGCVAWVICGSVDISVGVNSTRGFYIE